MKKIGVTQRVSIIEDYGERRDCLDQAWTELLESFDFVPIPLPNTVSNVSDYLEAVDIEGVVLTGGNDIADLDSPSNPAPERDRFERTVIAYCLSREVPILGVCRGMQLLYTYFNGDLNHMSGHINQDHRISFDPSDGVDSDLQFPESTTVNSYHTYGIDPEDVPEELINIGKAPDGSIECFTHREHQLYGIMWHPERGSGHEIDDQLISYLFGGSR